MQESLRDVVKDNFDKLMKFTETFKSVTPRLMNLAKGILSATAKDEDIKETIFIGRECWNDSFDLISKQRELPSNELELKEYQDYVPKRSVGLSR